MENFNNLRPITPVLIITAITTVINYPIKSISFENTGDEEGTVTIGADDIVISAGRSFNFMAGDNRYYEANTFSFEPVVGVNPATEFSIIIHK